MLSDFHERLAMTELCCLTPVIPTKVVIQDKDTTNLGFLPCLRGNDVSRYFRFNLRHSVVADVISWAVRWGSAVSGIKLPFLADVLPVGNGLFRTT